MRKVSAYFFSLLFYGLVVNSTTLQAADYPNRPIRIVVGFVPGGISDSLARILARVLARDLGQEIYVDNRPGAGTTIASEYVAKSSADGYTLYMQDLTTHAINASLYTKLPYDSLKDFSSITTVAASPLVLVVAPNSQIKTLLELIGKAKENPGKLNYGSSGIGAIVHLSGELFIKKSGIDMVHIPYKGASVSLSSVLSGELVMTLLTLPTAIPLIQSGSIIPLAVTGKKRAPSLPYVPTIEEAGNIQNYDIMLYSGILGPSGLPPKIINQLRDAIFKAIDDPEVKAFYKRVGADIVTSTPKEMGDLMAKQISLYGKIVKDSGITAD